MKVHESARLIMYWLAENQGATFAQIAATGLMTSRAASRAVSYAIRQGVMERTLLTGKGASENFVFRLTGRPLPVGPALTCSPSFDELLAAWGISLKPPRLPLVISHRHTQFD